MFNFGSNLWQKMQYLPGSMILTRGILVDPVSIRSVIDPGLLERSSDLFNSGEFKRQNCSKTQSVSTWFYKETETKFNRNLTENRRILFLCD